MGMGRKRKRAIAARAVLFLSMLFLLIGVLVIKTGRRKTSVEVPQAESRKETQDMADTMEVMDETDGSKGSTEESRADDKTTEESPTETEAAEEDETEAEAGETEREYPVRLTNADEFAKQIMASRTYLLEKKLSDYVERKKFKANGGTILDAAIPDDNVYCTEFYVELNNTKKSLVTLRWDPYSCTVTASKCQYTRQEIKDMVWAGERLAVTDISSEKDAAILEAQGQETETIPETEDGKEVVIE